MKTIAEALIIEHTNNKELCCWRDTLRSCDDRRHRSSMCRARPRNPPTDQITMYNIGIVKLRMWLDS